MVCSKIKMIGEVKGYRCLYLLTDHKNLEILNTYKLDKTHISRALVLI